MLSPVHTNNNTSLFHSAFIIGLLKDTQAGSSRQQSKPEQPKLCKPTSDLGSSAHIRSLMPHLRCRWLNRVWLCRAYLFSNPSSSCSTDIASALPVGPAFTSPCYSFLPPSSLISPHATCLSSPARPGISSSPYLKKKSLLPSLQQEAI